MHGFYNRILTIDLSAERFTIENISDKLLGECFGGKGLATHLLLERNPAGVEPFAPENNLIIATGPFCGGRLWGGSRYGEGSELRAPMALTVIGGLLVSTALTLVNIPVVYSILDRSE